MLIFGWSFLVIAVVLFSIASVGFAGTDLFGLKVAAALFLLCSFVAFAAEKNEPAP